MPCMCGDLRCWSCGPAQGNNRCENCGKWDDDENDDGSYGCNTQATCITMINEHYESEAQQEIETDKLIQEDHGHAYDPKLRCTYSRCQYGRSSG